MKKLLFNGHCGKCNNHFEFICDDNGPPAGGRILLSRKSLQPAVIYYFEDPVFDEVAGIVDDLLTGQGLSEHKVATRFDDIFGEICDPAPDSSSYFLGGDIPCPACANKVTSYGPTTPLKYCEVEIPKVTHKEWDNLTVAEKRRRVKALLEGK